ncbi:MAG: hypothetical protein JWO09_665 [Bacteroidetes bacterium]|nr:hypothetical protein [Bacteroidota bacterium]
MRNKEIKIQNPSLLSVGVLVLVEDLLLDSVHQFSQSLNKTN